MIVGIDASNISSGGGLTHLVELVSHMKPEVHGVKKILIWGSTSTLRKLPERDWILKQSHNWLDKSVVFRTMWQKCYLTNQAKYFECDLLFLPAGNTSSFHPAVSMCQNLLPFEAIEKRRFGFSSIRLRLEILKLLQCRSFKNSDGVIFLSEYSKRSVERSCGEVKNSKIVPHGVSEMFSQNENHKLEKNEFVEVIYVSNIDQYKHQSNVVAAIFKLLDEGYKINLSLIGAGSIKAIKEVEQQRSLRPNYSDSIKLLGKISYHELPSYYRKADIFLYASSCETFGMTILEAMKTGLPIACSEMSSMPEILKDGGIYFNPLNVTSITEALKEYLLNRQLRDEMSMKALNNAKSFSWERCADETIHYFKEIYQRYEQ
jgi:glycosyltransferase involved in cell wall biosynthesis